MLVLLYDAGIALLPCVAELPVGLLTLLFLSQGCPEPHGLPARPQQKMLADCQLKKLSASCGAAQRPLPTFWLV